MSSERKAKVNNFLGTCMDLVRKLFTFAFLSLDIMVYISVHNLVKFLLLRIHIFPYVLFSDPLVAFLVSFHLKTGFPLP
jgi:hypothetical protein